MKRIAVVALLIATVPLLSSCFLIVAAMLPGCEPYTVPFEQRDPDRIFRGLWSGSVFDYPTAGEETPLVLDLSATYLDAEHYRVSGTFQLGTQAPMAFEGRVDGSCAERYVRTGASALDPLDAAGAEDLEPQLQPPSASLDAEVRDGSGALVWEVQGGWPFFAGDETSITLVDPDEPDPSTRTAILARTSSP